VHELSVSTRTREELVDVTGEVEAALAAAGVESGWCHVFTPHTTCGVTINEGADPDVRGDLLLHLRELVPRRGGWRHSEGNSDAHVKASLVGCQVTIPVVRGRLRLGRWQAVFLCEFDGPRERSVWVSHQP
jgi:secondary thiamine-phosphate synthase enzyme